MPRFSGVIDDTPEHLKKCRHAMNFIEHDEPTALCSQVGIRIVEASDICRTFKVEIDGLGVALRDLTSESGLAHLTGSQHSDRGEIGQKGP